jgi:hypothetical protein
LDAAAGECAAGPFANPDFAVHNKTWQRCRPLARDPQKWSPVLRQIAR